jgi:Carboxypeptidase regulatory-like domain
MNEVITMKKINDIYALLALVLFLVLVFFAAGVSSQTGGTFDLSHSVIATGGGSNSTGGTFNVSGTVGQHIAGTSSNGGGRFDLHGGFWFQNQAPTAASVSISGRVTTASGQGIRSVRLTLTSPNGAIRRALTSSFGYYAFDGIEVGNTYVMHVAAKRFTFAEPTRVFSLQDELTGMDFTATLQ